MPAPAITAINGLRGTGQFDVDFRPTNYRELYTFLEPNGDAPLNALLAMMGSESTDDPKYNNFRDHMPDRALAAAANSLAASSTLVLTASDENQFVIVGSILVNMATGEVMHVTAVNPDGVTFTVTKNIGGGALNVTSGDNIIVAGFAASEGADTPEPISFDATLAYNYTQIFRFAFSVSGTLQHTYLRTGPKHDENRKKALKLHMSDIERAMFFGNKAILNPTTAKPTRFTGGVINEITGVTDISVQTNGVNADANVLTEFEFDRLLIDTIFAWGSKEKLCFVGPTIAGHMQKFGKERWSPSQVSGSYGVSFVRYQTFAGDLLVHVHPQFRQVPGMQDAMVCLDAPYLKYRYMEGRDTQLLSDRQGNGEDLKTDEWLTECGLELMQDLPHHYISGWALTEAPAGG